MKPQCNTSADCLRELARVMDQFGITGSILATINSRYVKYTGSNMGGNVFMEIPSFYNPHDWQFAIAEVEGKPVFIWDELYYFDRKIHAIKAISNTCIGADDGMNYSVSALTWNPPKPATVMVELIIEDAEFEAGKRQYNFEECIAYSGRKEAACKTALEKLK